jgi:ubiquitin C-terminal hydrolase
MAHIKTFEDFKNNMVLVDKGIAENNGENLRKAIDIAISWLHYAQRPDTDQDRVNYTYSNYIPTLLRTILGRRYDISHEDASNLLDIIIAILPMLTTKIGSNEVVDKCVEQIFSPYHPLYMKLACFDKPPELPAEGNGGGSTHDPSFIASLEVGSCIDCLRNNNQWEMAIIENFSDVRTECEIAFNDEERLWISLFNHNRFAPFGTKTGLVETTSSHNIESSSTAAAETSSKILQPPSIPLIDVPPIGELVDARNPQGIWYQACVMDTREEEREVQLDLAPALEGTSSVASEQPPGDAQMDVCESEDTKDDDKCVAVQQLPSKPTFEKKKITFLRIAYVGMFESNDEWIEMPSGRLAVLNSTSSGRRGEYSLREEIFHRAWRGSSYSLDPSQATEVAYYMDYSFTSPGYVHLVRHFYAVGGVHTIFRCLQAVNNEQAPHKVDMSNALLLIRTLNHISLVLSRSFYQQHQSEMLRSISTAFRSISQHDIRSIPVEDIECAMQAFETFFYRHFDRYQEGSVIERFYLEYLWHFLQCPFLNRRLGGLKFLQDLLKRASLKSLYPDGIQKIEMSKDKVSYKVQKVTYCLTIHQICEFMMKQNILDSLYLGADAHDSLIERSGNILRYLSLADVMETNHYLGLIRAGLEKNKAILKILPEMTATLKDEKIVEVLDFIATVDHVQVNQELVGIVSSVIERYRTKLMYAPHPSKVIVPWKALHEQAVKILWSWMLDESETSDSVAEAAAKKLETTMEIGISHQKALEDKTFRWDIQWIRTKPLLDLIIDSLRMSKSIVPCLKLLGGFVYSWPMQYNHGVLVDNAAPFEPKRSSAATYLMDSLSLFGILGNCVVSVREWFVQQHSSELAAWKSDFKKQEGSPIPVEDLSSLPTVSAALKLKDTRTSYHQHLEQILDAVHMLFRSVEKKKFPTATFELIWEQLIASASISEEFECAMNLIAKIPTKFTESTSTAPVEGGLGSRESSCDVASKTTGITVSGSFFHLNQEAYVNFFRQHLCDEDDIKLFANRFFTLKTFRCMEKWFRWINSEMGHIECGKDNKVVSVLVDPVELVGVDTFVRVCFATNLELVANASVTMITSLTRSAKHSKQFRESLMSRTIGILHDINNNMNDSFAQRNMKRSLMLLDGLIDESYLLSSRRMYPHSSLFVGNKAIFRISGTSKNIKSFNGEISLRLGETVEDLFNAVAKELKLTPHEIKIFRQGKEILPAEFRKTISQLPMCAGERSTLVVAERPHKTNSSASSAANATATAVPTSNNKSESTESVKDGKADSDSFVTVVPAATAMDSDRPVALLISTTMDTFQCFFELLSKSQGDQIDHIWQTIGQLPTSWHTVAAWYHMDCQDVKELAFPLDIRNMHRVGELIYILQVIEIILYPVISLKDLVNQFGLQNEASGIETVALWCEKFVTKNGLQFLCHCYEWITNIMVEFNRSSLSSPLNGMNLSLLLLGSRTTTKLLKGFLSRSLAEDRDNSIAHKFLEDFLLRFDNKKVLNMFTPHFSDELNLTLRLQQIREKLVQADGGSGMNNKANDHMQLGVDPQLVICTEAIYWSCLIRFTAIMEMEKQGKLNSSSSSSRTILEAKKSFDNQEKRMLASSMQSLLFLWTSVSISNPKVLKQLHSSKENLSYKDVFQAIAESRCVTSSSSDNQKNELDIDGFSISLVDWFPTAFMEFVQWTMILPEIQALVVEAISTLIDLRPIIQIQVSSENSSSSENGNEIFDHYFVLVTKLLQVALEHHWNVGNMPSISRVILNELRGAVQGVVSESSSCEICNLKGNLSLFIKLCNLDESLLSSYTVEESLDIINFLVRDVLGFGSITDPYWTASTKLFLSNEAKASVYEVVQAFCDQRSSLAIHVYQFFKHIHRALEPPKEWEVLPERQGRSRLGFVGLKNFGATCYMNSLLQVMYSNYSVRQYLLNELNLDDGDYTEEELRNNLWYQLQTIFLYLQYSERKSYSPGNWTFAFKDETGAQPLNTMTQQDAQEFLQLLFERCENMMNKHNEKLKEKANKDKEGPEKEVVDQSAKEDDNSQFPHDVLNETFAGSFCNIMYVAPSATAGGLSSVDAIQQSIHNHGIRTQQESFVCISVDLVGPNLQSSLETFVKGETISDFTWKENAPKCEIVKKQCLAQLSDSLIFHLKRFKYNFDTFHREKINDKFAFPMDLDMKPYTREGQPEFQPYNPHLYHSHKSGENTPISGIESGENSPALPLSPVDLLEIASRTPAYYEYELTGVVVHTGTADSGHYYAFLKNAETGLWCEFNDSEISSFDITKLEQDCFGGTKKCADYIHATQSIVETVEANPKNAYMLIYNRKAPLKYSRADSIPKLHLSSNSVLLQTVHSKILFENVQHRLACRVLAKDHLRFYVGILRIMIRQASSEAQSKSDETPALRSTWVETLRFLLKYALHTPHSAECLALSAQMKQWFAQEFSNLQQSSDSSILVPAVPVLAAMSVDEPGDIINDKENILPELLSSPVVTAAMNSDDLLPPPPPSVSEEANSPAADSEAVILPPPPPPTSSEKDEFVLVAKTDAIQSDSPPQEGADVPPALQDVPLDTADAAIVEVASNTTAEVVTPLLTATPLTSREAISCHLLEYLCENGDLITQVFFAPNVQYREAVQALFFEIFSHAWFIERDAVDSWLSWQRNATGESCVISNLGIFDRMVMALTLPDPTTSSIPVSGISNTSNGGGMMDFHMDSDLANEDPELLLALKLSQESSLPNPSAASSSGTSAAISSTTTEGNGTAARNDSPPNPLLTVTNSVDFPHSVVRFLIEITQDHRLQMIPDEWRKSGQFIAFLASVLRFGGRNVAQIFVRRDLIGQLLDIFLGDVSPLKGKVYFFSTAGNKHVQRKRAPSSYVTGYITKDYPKSLPLSLRSIPDWSALLDCVVMMVSECLLSNEARDFYQNRRRRVAVPISSPFHDLLMSEYDFECLTCKTLYTTLMKQARYRSYVCALVKLLTPNNFNFSNMMLEILWEECTVGTPEACLVIFEVAESLLSVRDVNFRQRVYSLLGRGQQSIVEFAATMVNQSNKAHFLLAFIRSYVFLLQRIPELCSVIANPIDNVPHWAKWMLQHCHSIRQAGKITAMTNDGNTPAVGGGPFIVIFGESEEERELPWAVRAERTYEMLALRLFEWGLEPDTWIVENAVSSAIIASTLDDHPPPLLLTNDHIPTETCTVINARPRNINEPSSLSVEKKLSLQNTSSNSLDSTNAIDGDGNDHSYQELPGEDHHIDGKPTSEGKKTVSINTKVEEIGDGDVLMLMDGMTDEELERALANGSMFQ